MDPAWAIKQAEITLGLETTKQLMLICTTAVTILIGFHKDYIGPIRSNRLVVLLIAIGFFALSIVAGEFVLMAMANMLRNSRPEDVTIYAPHVRYSAVCQHLAFILAIVFVFIYSAINLLFPSIKAETPKADAELP